MALRLHVPGNKREKRLTAGNADIIFRVEHTGENVAKLEAEVQKLTGQLRHRAFGGDPAPLHTRLVEIISTIEDLLGGLKGVSVKRGEARESREGLRARLGKLMEAVQKVLRHVKL